MDKLGKGKSAKKVATNMTGSDGFNGATYGYPQLGFGFGGNPAGFGFGGNTAGFGFGGNPVIGFGGNNLMAGLGCFQLDPNNNIVQQNRTTLPGPVDLMGLIEACRKFTKPSLIAGAAFDFMFREEIARGDFNDGNWNVYGVAPNGRREEYIALNPMKINAMERFVRDKIDQGADKDATWKSCVKAINRKIWKIQNKDANDDEDETNV